MNRDGIGSYAPNLSPCDNKKTHAFFDPFHASESMHFIRVRKFLGELLNLTGMVA